VPEEEADEAGSQEASQPDGWRNERDRSSRFKGDVEDDSDESERDAHGDRRQQAGWLAVESDAVEFLPQYPAQSQE